jgi:hypothetical protein
VESCKLRYFNSFEFFDHTGFYLYQVHLQHRLESYGYGRSFLQTTIYRG